MEKIHPDGGIGAGVLVVWRNIGARSQACESLCGRIWHELVRPGWIMASNVMGYDAVVIYNPILLL